MIEATLITEFSKVVEAVLLVEPVPAMFQTEAPCNKHSHLLLDINFGFWQKIAHQATKHVILQKPSKCSIEGDNIKLKLK